MQKFLLLRNNKQTGPYSVEELEQMGLRPYDLIWVNGKSAAWRYPGEIDDLKSFAPPVEEQPYDRFYKKPSEESQKKKEPVKLESSNESSFFQSAATNNNGNGNGNGNGGNGLNFTPPVSTPPKKNEKEYKRVFVTLPTTQAKKPAAVEEPIVQQPTTTPVPKSPDPIPAVTEKQKPLRVNAQVDDDQRHSSIDIYYTRKKPFYSNRSFLVSAFAIGIIALVGLGVFIGLSLQKPNTETGKQETERVYRVSDNENKTSSTGNNQKETTILPPAANQNTVPLVDSAALALQTKKPKQNNNTSLKSQLKNLQQKSSVKPIDSGLLHIAPTKSEPEKVVEKPKPNFSKLVSVSNNDFQVGPFGGISKLELTVHNSSEYSLDLVVVDLEYLKVNKEVYKTETLYFKDVAANSSVTVTAPKSSRGNKINYKISLITAKDKLYHASSD
jgi:hypothetical protein